MCMHDAYSGLARATCVTYSDGRGCVGDGMQPPGGQYRLVPRWEIYSFIGQLCQDGDYRTRPAWASFRGCREFPTDGPRATSLAEKGCCQASQVRRCVSGVGRRQQSSDMACCPHAAARRAAGGRSQENQATDGPAALPRTRRGGPLDTPKTAAQGSKKKSQSNPNPGN
jgi:hypothetical protein